MQYQSDVASMAKWTNPGAERAGVSPFSEQDLATLMARYVAGDEAAFGDLYRAAAPRLFGYLVRLTRDAARAEDLVQVSFLKLYRSRDRYEAGAAVMPWLFTIARNSFHDEVRGRRARNEELTFDGTLPEFQSPPQVRDVEIRQEVMQALETVPTKQRDAVVLTKLFGFSVAEAASLLGTTANSLKIRVHRGLHGLRDYAWA